MGAIATSEMFVASGGSFILKHPSTFYYKRFTEWCNGIRNCCLPKIVDNTVTVRKCTRK